MTNRRNFFRTLGLGILAAPAAALAASEQPATRRSGMKVVAEIPAEAGQVRSMICYDKRIFVACDKSIFAFDPRG